MVILCLSGRAYMMQKGCACRFLYGPGTDQEKITEIDKALEAKTELQVEVQFYRKNGRNFCFPSFFLWTIINNNLDMECKKYRNTKIFIWDFYFFIFFLFLIVLFLFYIYLYISLLYVYTCIIEKIENGFFDCRVPLLVPDGSSTDYQWEAWRSSVPCLPEGHHK